VTGVQTCALPIYVIPGRLKLGERKRNSRHKRHDKKIEEQKRYASYCAPEY